MGHGGWVSACEKGAARHRGRAAQHEGITGLMVPGAAMGETNRGGTGAQVTKALEARLGEEPHSSL